MTVIFFAGPRLDHGDADQSSSNEADYLERRDAKPPVVVRGYGVSGHPVSVIRAGKRVEDAELVTSADLAAYGFDPASLHKWWLFQARDAYGNTTTGVLRRYQTPTQWLDGGDNQGFAPPFSFRPSAVIPMPNGWLFCLAAPLVNTFDLARWGEPQFSGVFREFYRVYRRNGDWVQDFPELHGAPIHDVHRDGDGNCFVAGDEVGEERYSFRKYDGDYQLQWSVSFKDYWPLSVLAVRTSNTDFSNGRAQFNQRPASVRIEPAGDGSFYVLSEISYTGGSSTSGFRRYRRHRPFMQIARVSASGGVLWSRVLEVITRYGGSAQGEPSRHNLSCKALDNHKIAVFFRYSLPVRYSVGIVGGDYSWDYMYQVFKTDAQWTYQEIYDNAYVDIIDWQNGLLVNADGSLSGHLFPYEKIVLSTVTTSQGVVLESSVRYPKTLIHSIMRYADERLTVWSRRIRYSDDTYNIDPEYVKHVFYKDLTLLSEAETPAFDHLQPIALAEDGSLYRGTRTLKTYEEAYSGPFAMLGVLCAMHFQVEDADGDPLWDGITATARLGLNKWGRIWREWGRWRNIRGNAIGDADISPQSADQEIEKYRKAHDDFIVQTNAHGELESGDLIRVTGGTFDTGQGRVDFWLPATDIVIAYNSPPPALALPVFLKTPRLIGPVDSRPPGLPLPIALSAPILRREYVGPLAVQVYRLTLGDLEIPFSTLIARKTDFEVTVSAICPAASEPLVAAILARDTDLLTVWRGVRFPDGTEQLDPLLSGTLTGIRYDRGARSGSITLDLRQEPAATPARIRSLAALSRRDARFWSSPLPDIFINPGDTAVVGAISFTVGSVDYLINPNEARMTVGEAEG